MAKIAENIKGYVSEILRGNLEKLEQFGASYVKLKEIPESIRNIKNIKVLIFAANEISKIPVSIGNLSKISILSVSRKKIKTYQLH
ncbi:hypothetical protein M3O96_04875 [Aquiflexum sp. TKW24L]|uniref:hypothetical protein n=1 Tax=Aquiflexum sp. TKW24L TaxID=2942212 RepID=UPI0020BE0434|nr:hypothetical protein [Aquiflexum sp. TKW24L]MCL6258409.1 hypothetical protein [Aquiflexum sp. TKW24L]